MGFVRGVAKAAAGAGAGVALLTALPVFGAVGAITAAGLVVGAGLGAAAGVADEVIEAKGGQTRSKARSVQAHRDSP